MALTEDQKRILAQTLLGEAGGEGYQGMLAVAHVLNNRANSGRFPNDPVSVALQPKQFSTWNSGQGGNNPGRFGPGSSGYEDAIKAVEAVFEGGAPDPTYGSTHYWSPSGMRAMGYGSDPYWAGSEQSQFGRLPIGNHVFLPQSDPSAALSAINTAAPNVPAPPTAMGYAPSNQPPSVPQSAPVPMPPMARPQQPDMMRDTFAALGNPTLPPPPASMGVAGLNINPQLNADLSGGTGTGIGFPDMLSSMRPRPEALAMAGMQPPTPMPPMSRPQLNPRPTATADRPFFVTPGARANRSPNTGPQTAKAPARPAGLSPSLLDFLNRQTGFGRTDSYDPSGSS